MESKTIKHLMYCPFTGLGLHKGFRGNRWLKNRIEIFKQFVIPSLKIQSSQNFILWISWRREERNNKLVKEFMAWLDLNFNTVDGKKVVHTFAGICFYDDKYPDEQARARLIDSIHYSMPTLLDYIGGADYVLMTIQPSDDIYHDKAVEGLQKMFETYPDFNACGFPKGYICNYNTKELAEYNPQTNPPFYTIKFPFNEFTDAFLHCKFTSMKREAGKYKIGTPLPSHEYVGDCFKLGLVKDLRCFMVGTHGANISTTFNIPYKGIEIIGQEREQILKSFGIWDVAPLQIKISFQKKLLLKLSFKAQRKIRYWLSECLGINILS